MSLAKSCASLFICFLVLALQSLFHYANAQSQAASPESIDLNLNTTQATLPAEVLFESGSPGSQSTVIAQEGSNLTVDKNSVLTPAQYIAAMQVLTGGSQTLQLSSQGNAIGGSFAVNGSIGNIANMVVPQGVTAINNFAANSLNLTGNFTNSGTFYAISTNPSISTAVIQANNIENHLGGVISTVLPSNGISGYANLVSNLNLSLISINNIINAGTIASSGSLNMQAGGSIVNSLPSGVSGPSPVLQAFNFINLNSQSIINTGLIASLNSNINVTLAEVIRNAFVFNNLSGQLQALSGAVNINIAGNSNSLLGTLNIVGGDFLSQTMNVNTPGFDLAIDAQSISGILNIETHTGSVHVSQGELNLGTLSFTGDPLFYDSSGAAINIAGGIFTNGNPLVVVSAGDININGIFASNASIITSQVSGSAGQVLLVAGANITTAGSGLPAPVGTTIDIDSFNASGNITVSNEIHAFGTGGGSGADVTLVAPGTISVGGRIVSSADSAGAGQNGNVKIIAGQSSGQAISLSSIDTNGTANGGSISIYTAAPTLSAAVITLDGTSCAGCSSFFLPGVANTAQVSLGATGLFSNTPITIGDNTSILSSAATLTIQTPQLNLGANSQIINSAGVVAISSGSGQNLQILGPNSSSSTISGKSTMPGAAAVAIAAANDQSLQLSSAGAGNTTFNINGPLSLSTTSLAARTITVDNTVNLKSNDNISILFNNTGDGNLVNNGIIESSSNAANSSITVASSGSLNLSGNGTIKFTNGGLPSIALVAGAGSQLNVSGSPIFDTPGFVQFMAFNAGSSVNFGMNSAPQILNAEHALVFTHTVSFADNSFIDASTGNHIFFDAGIAGNFINFTLPSLSSARISSKAIEINEPVTGQGPNSNVITFSSSGAGNATLNLDGGPTLVFGSTININPAVTLNSSGQQLSFFSSNINLNGSTSVTGAAAGLLFQGNNASNSLTLSMGAGSQISNTSGGGIFFNSPPVGTFSKALGGNLNAAGQVVGAGPITINGGLGMGNITGGTSLFNGGNNPVQINVNSITSLITGNSASFTLTDNTGNIQANNANSGLRAVNGSVNLNATAGQIIVDPGTVISASQNVILNAQSGISSGTGTQITAGTLAAGFNQNSINVLDYNSSAFLSPGAVTLTTQTGNIILTDNTVRSNGGSIALASLAGDISLATGGGGGNFFFAQGGNVTLNALNNITTAAGTSLGAVARFVPGATPVPIVGNTLPGYQGGDIGIVAGQIIPNMDSFLRTNYDMTRTLNPQYIPIGNLDLTGTPVPAPLNGGSVILDNKLVLPMVITGSFFNVDGSVVYIDPATIVGTGFGAFGPPSNFVAPVPGGAVLIPVLPAAPGAPAAAAAPIAITVNPPNGLNNTTITRTDTLLEPTELPAQQEQIQIVTVNQLEDGMTFGSQCQQLVIELKDKAGTVYATLVASAGTTLQVEKRKSLSIEDRMLTMKEGKIVVISSDKKGFTLKSNNSIIDLPADSVSVVEQKKNGAVIAGVLAGDGELSVLIQGYGNNNTVVAKRGQEIAFGNDSEQEELIPVDGTSREIIEAHILLADLSTTKTIESQSATGSASRSELRQKLIPQNLRVEKRQFDEAARIRNERLLKCLDCLRAKCSKEQCANLLRKLRLTPEQPISAKSPFTPIAQSEPLKQTFKFSTTDLESALIRHYASDSSIKSLNKNAISIGNGEYLLLTKAETTVHLGIAVAKIRPDTVALLRKTNDSVSVFDLWDSKGNAIEIHSGGKYFSLQAGQESVIGPKETVSSKILKDQISRRRIYVRELSDKLAAVHSEASFISIVGNSDVLQKVCSAKETSDKHIASKVFKMATVLNMVTSNHGPYSSK